MAVKIPAFMVATSCMEGAGVILSPWTTFCAAGDLLGQQEGKDALDDRLRLQAHRLVERRAADDAVRGLPVIECDLRTLRND
jgi:hypothetical protein